MPGPSARSRTSTRLLGSPKVTRGTVGRSQRRISPPALPSSWKWPPTRKSPADRQHPATDPVRVGQRVPDVGHRRRVAAVHLHRHEVAILGDIAADGADLLGDVENAGSVMLAPHGQGWSPPGTAAAGQLGAESVEPMTPRTCGTARASCRPGGATRPPGVDPAGSGLAHAGEAGFAKHPELLGNRRLADPELGRDRRHHLPGGMFPLGEDLQDPPPDRVAQHVQRVHTTDSIDSDLYKSRPMDGRGGE